MTSGLPDIASWWQEPGRAGMTGQSWYGTSFPRTLAGFAAGAWSTGLPGRVEAGGPFPGVLAASPMLAGYDSIAFVPLAGAAAGGFEGALVTAVAVPAEVLERRTRGIVHLAGGSHGFDDNGLAIERGDSLNWTRVEVVTGSHDRAGSLERSGHHLWQVATQWSRGPHRVEGGFGHRGSSQLVVGGEEQSARGEAGYVRYRNAGKRRWWGVSAERGYDAHESFGGFLDLSRRDAQASRGALAGGWLGDRMELAARIAAGESEVRRQGEGAFESGSRWAFGSLSMAMPVGPGRAEALLGLGRHGAFDVFEPAPSLSYRVERSRWSVRAGMERAMWAAWTDLEPGQAPFLQSTWAGVIDARLRGATHGVRGFVMAGRSRDRALVSRQPIEDLWLREGFHADPEPYTFALAGGDLEWRRRRWEMRGEGFALVRTASADAPEVDPPFGLRAEAGYRTSFFAGDLGVLFRAGVEAVGARESEGLFEVRTLPAYATSFASVSVTLAQAVFALQGRNLEDRVREETWLDTDTLSEALGTGRELRFAVTVRLSN